ncbi:FAD-dependent oxidoreductase [Cryobacterium sp.]|jgi:3-phenylpropionate/trans-cinnamate dioxygenase ferredoxin reductase subunit|uniref:NAD(P)/FAD-dependent oxidoreductase n=1 Tax=Cryobacterium sp. TaxID=1926290 RepID=UPI00260FB2AE|nr:FAD-dependent oxidoreductase [Cryobacterium sp.]MCU1447261.1 FAD-dependent pyridine nucleotide-disulfide oxidoreductase [Cryobacterium sp.]
MVERGIGESGTPGDPADEPVVIVGAGLAGARAAEAVRAGSTGRVLLIGEEIDAPYIRPPLSKEYLAGTAGRDVVDVHPVGWYAENGIERIAGHRAAVLDRGGHRLTLDDGRTVRYSRLLLAMGASPRPFPGPGASLPGVHYLRSLADSERLRTALAAGGRRVVIIGTGWIGLEVAAAARGYGNEAIVLGRGAVPLASAVGAEVGAVFEQLHRDHGVHVGNSTTVVELEGESRSGGTRVTGVRLSDRTLVRADLVVVGLGATPNTQLALGSGLSVENGIAASATFATSDPDVFAVGDVANVFHPRLGHRMRVEHWANADTAGAAAGRAILGDTTEYDAIPYFYTDQFDLGMEYSGFGELAAQADVVFRGDRAGRRFVAFWLADGQVVAGMNVNVWGVNETVQRLIRSGVRVEANRLTDENIALEDLLLPLSG